MKVFSQTVFYSPPEPTAPPVYELEQRSRLLWAKLIQRMVYDFLNGIGSRDIKTLKLANDARAWLFESKHSHSLAGICGLLDMDVVAVRAHIRTLGKQDTKKGAFLISCGEDEQEGVRIGAGEGVWGKDWTDLPDWDDWRMT